MTTDTPAKSGQFKALDTIGFCADVGGRGFHLPNAMAIRDDGHLYVISRSSQMHPKGTRIGICGVDPATGDRSLISSSTIGNGPLLGRPEWIIVDLNGELLVQDDVMDTIFRIDPISGNRTIITSFLVGQGPLAALCGTELKATWARS